ncbi:glycosyltransferase family 4 protein [Enterovibrio nigricans]|uniref:Glycosyltransferase involved in cell wall bisynthesis n=1 Tax=Enterovibrio nigricans DSM 22720 TaxID=1121868 RepID=A0A1T4U7W1_9GAMM|nr:glycosyltransferase family 4 protein [Enterovibrio nigricans]PKF51776.1 ABC transporter permease [Enterovibrio nigricans]SKA48757.1 Glycosyltransferase involved in cell wall bisynthesis [Enterovibrio nigricans DSM 22720]
MTIKVTHVNSGDLIGRRFNGYDLKPYLDQLGVETKQLVYWNKQSEADFVSKAFDYPGSRHITRGLNIVENRLSLHAKLHPHSWTLPYHKEIKSADIVHMHIIHDGYFSLDALPYLSKRKPVVWTWHDPWPMTGHCIYPMTCEKWKKECGECPSLDTPFAMRKDRTNQQYLWKNRTYSKTKAEIVLASNWMLEMAQNSPFSEYFNFTVIPFGLDLEKYKPRDKKTAREKLGVFSDRTVIFIRASSTPFKGLSEFISSVEKISPDIKLCIISLQETGHFDQFIGKHQIIEFGWSNDEELLLNAYAACDFFAMPSMAEAFGLMAIEAMACARPVLSFDSTSLHNVTFAPDAGISVPIGDTQALAEAINHLSTNKIECEERGKLSRQLAEKHYDIARQAQLSYELYDRVLKKSQVS